MSSTPKEEQQKTASARGDFRGTAEDYAQFRVPYPKDMLSDLRTRAGVGENDTLLDLGCGPGRVAIPLAPHFREVWAVDREPEMIEAGRAQARAQKIDNLRWTVAAAEELDAPADSFGLITIGEAFHRFDRALIAERALEWLRPKGCLAILGCYGILRGSESWQGTLRDTVEDWKTATTKSSARGEVHDEEFLRQAGFVEIETRDFQQPHLWTLDSIIGNLRSTSAWSRRALGDRVEAFDSAIRAALLAFDESGTYRETLRFGYTLARCAK